MSQKTKFTIEFVKFEFESRGCQLISNNYINNIQKLNVICQNGHNYNVCFRNFKRGDKCPDCTGNKRLTHEFVENEFKKANYQLLSTYKNSFQILKFICHKKHNHQISYTNFQQGQRCGKCFEISLNGCENINHSQIYRRILEKTNIEEEKLIFITKKISDEILNFYNKTPFGNVVDHVISFSWFNHDNEKEIYACWSIENLQYLTFTDNAKKSNKLTFKQYQQLTKQQLDILKLANNKPNYIKDYQLKAFKLKGLKSL